MGSFLYPSLIRLSRPQGNAGFGAQPYSGLSQDKETVIVTAARAHIQPERQGGAPLAGLPGDAAGQPTWKIILKLPKGTVRKRDVLTDELGNRYQAVYAAWTPLATTVLAVDLNGPGTPPPAFPPFPESPWQTPNDKWELLAGPWGAETPWPALGGAWDSLTANWELLQ